MELFYNPLSRSSQKVLIALYEKQANFFPRIIHLHDPLERRSFADCYPLCSLPLLVTKDGLEIPDSSSIIEYVEQKIPAGTQLCPPEPARNLRNRMLDRLIDNQLYRTLYEMEKHLHLPEHLQQPLIIRQQQKQLKIVLNELEKHLRQQHWLCGNGFTMADCALIPALYSLPKEIRLMEFFELNRYRQQAELRGSWSLVKEEIEQVQSELHSGIQPQS
ncbi:glutathione S-transferase family protein [Shewanella avicenniae]|uniref:Glutathione S-transferase family protein n=1 Tax=Shewanella avicenniae TaxID=2814294 RepID=A0ABX7QSB3_9GAMM|nr:glutathione S-transferase family protein [Shewanella avicenniae]QSX33590.1 glutathione S-transferase family protein [Shewanella avicenniae]